PPPALIIYAILNILRPSFILGQIPDLLNLLCAVEGYRRYAVLKAGEALDWQVFYESTSRHEGVGGEVRLLAEKEAKRLKGYTGRSELMRREYLLLVRSLIQLYIHYLWISPESCLLGKRLNDFFPGCIEGISRPSSLLFHADLEEKEEKEEFGKLKEECQGWMNMVVEWEAGREEKGVEDGLSKEDMDVSYADEFREAFPPPFDSAELGRNIEIYVRKVEDMVRKLDEWFGPSSSGLAGVHV
ncbi:hypothetical protein HYDPIDRAFT_85798, partial [Hydnomerulius pinastri MD-312]